MIVTALGLLAILAAIDGHYRNRPRADAKSESGRKLSSSKTPGNDTQIQNFAPKGPTPPWYDTVPIPAMRIPLQPDLIVVTAVGAPEGDYESIKRVKSLSGDSISVGYSADVPHTLYDPYSGAPHGMKKVIERVVAVRTVLREDLKTSHYYQQSFSPQDPESTPGTTAMTTSSAVLEDLKAKAQADISFEAPDLGGMREEKETIERVEPRPVPFSVLLNDQRVDLPAVHAQGILNNCHLDITDETGFHQEDHTYRDDFYFLDNPENPLVLSWDLGPCVAKLRVIKISFPEDQSQEETAQTYSSENGSPQGNPASGAAQAGNKQLSGNDARISGGRADQEAKSASVKKKYPQIELKLAQAGRAEVYGIYFDFQKAVIREESEPVLKEIANTLVQNPTWKLRVEGHTDNVGGDAYNLELSTQRAEAVKKALVATCHIAADRLNPIGFGASQPKAPNDTLEGRARNRRVELVRKPL